MGLGGQVKYIILELYLLLEVPMVEISKESDKVRERDKRPCLIKGTALIYIKPVIFFSVPC